MENTGKPIIKLRYWSTLPKPSSGLHLCTKWQHTATFPLFEMLSPFFLSYLTAGKLANLYDFLKMKTCYYSLKKLSCPHSFKEVFSIDLKLTVDEIICNTKNNWCPMTKKQQPSLAASVTKSRIQSLWIFSHKPNGQISTNYYLKNSNRSDTYCLYQT